jgi:hypothetical protein
MTFRPALSIVLGLFLVVSLSLKLPGLITAAVGEASVIPRDIATVLERHEFQVKVSQEQVVQEAPDELAWVYGAAGACQVRIAEVALQGWHRSLVSQLATGNQLFYMFGGETYSEQPIMRTRTYAYWRKLNRYLGLSTPNRPVLALIAMPACQNVPLRELAVLSGSAS